MAKARNSCYSRHAAWRAFAGMPRDEFFSRSHEMCQRFVGLRELDKECKAEFGISFSEAVREGVSDACWRCCG